MTVTVRPDSERQRVLLTVSPGSRWAEMEAAGVDMVRRIPDLADWNWIIDDQGPMADVDVAGMVRIGAVFRAATSDPERRTFTVVVTKDPFFAEWARVIDLHYGARRHFAAATLAAAHDLLDRLEMTAS